MSFTKEEKDKILLIDQFRIASDSDRYRLFSRIRDTRLPLYTLRRNYKDLFNSISRFHNNAEKAEFWSLPYLRPNIQKNISKNLFNYLSAVCAIIDLSRRSARKLLSKLQQASYFHHVKDVYVDSVEYRIIRNLRNYISHYANPKLGVYTELDYQKGSKHAFYLHTKELLEWDEWDQEERQYLTSIGKKFEIENLLRRYHTDFVQTQNKYFHDVIRNHFEVLNEFANDMQLMIIKGKQFRIMNFPIREGTLRWLKYVLIKVGESKSV